jgi:SpoVK/Ycf46/Vps4 family AAA+-type ATPase
MAFSDVINSEFDVFEKYFTLLLVASYIKFRKPIHLVDNLDKIFKNDLSQHELIKHSFLYPDKKNILITKGILTVDEDDSCIILLSDKSIDELEMKQKIKVEEKKNPDLKYYKLEELPPLHFSDEVEEHIDRLTNILQKENFDALLSNLKKHNQPQLFNIFFYGISGGGKSSCAKYLSALTNRPLMEVSISSLRDSYYGKSEQILESMFAKYASNKDQGAILYMDELDGIIQNRSQDSSSSTDNTEHRLQKIILNQLEGKNLEGGILIGTSNFGKFDSAVERRFLYKIEFKMPPKEVRNRIWRSSLPEYENNDFYNLLSDYPLQGGLISNIVRKAMVEKILVSEEVLDQKLIIGWVEEELAYSNKNEFGNIGFKKAS